MKLTRDEIFRLTDAFTDFLEDLVGQNITFKREPGVFHVEHASAEKKARDIGNASLTRLREFQMSPEDRMRRLD